jgi:hemerythrin-like metal-binding protein
VAAQHGHLSAAVRELNYLQATGAPWDDLADTLDRLIDDVKLHFEHEELELERAAYPKLDAHRHLHASFIRRLTALRQECDRKETELMGVLVELLESWLSAHEATADREAIEFLEAGR